MEKPKILYVEDDLTLSFVTRDNLEQHGFSIDFCEDGEAALEMFGKNTYNLCILDVMLPKMDGFELARRIRQKNEEIPIIFLTAKSTKEDKIHGLKLGGDDYITKPFSIEELALKVKIFLKRSGIKESSNKEKFFKIGKYTFDSTNQTLSIEEQSRPLTLRETQILKLFCQNKNSIVKRDDLLMKVWGEDHYFASRSLDVFISRIRKYLSQDQSLSIENIHNVGYKLVGCNNSNDDD
jgi:DNA-binding response OmpR family regulator